MAEELSPLERDVISTIVAPWHPVMDALRRQLDDCRVASREFTGVGFVTVLGTEPDVEPAPVRPGTMRLGDVTAAIDGLARGAGFVLSIRDGVLNSLEGYSYDEPWPQAPNHYAVTAGGVRHEGKSETDTEEVDAAWDRSRDGPGR